MKTRNTEVRECRLLVAPETRPEYRAATGDKPPMITGYAAVFNKRSQNLGGFVEKVDPGFFTRTLQTADVMGLFNHDPSGILGRSGAGTMRLSVDETGLRYEIDQPDTTVGRDVAEYARRGDLVGSSFSFGITAGGDSWGQTETGFPERTLLEGRLYDVGPVTFPAYLDTGGEDTRVALRSLAGNGRSLDQLVEAASRNRLAALLSKRAEFGGDPSFNDIRELVADAIADHLGLADDVYCYVADCGDTWAVYEIGNDYFQIDYSMDSTGVITFSGDPVEVARQTTWVTAPPEPEDGPGRSLPPGAPTALRNKRLALLARR